MERLITERKFDGRSPRGSVPLRWVDKIKILTRMSLHQASHHAQTVTLGGRPLIRLPHDAITPLRGIGTRKRPFPLGHLTFDRKAIFIKYVITLL